MNNTAGIYRPKNKRAQSEGKINTSDLRDYVGDWMLDAQMKGCTVQTIRTNRARIGKFVWFIEQQGYPQIGGTEIKAFILYLQTAHESAEGRWGKPKMREPISPIMVKNYLMVVKAFFNYLREEEVIDFDPTKRVRIGNVQTEVKQPISDDDILKLLRATKLSSKRRREEAILLTLLDSGMRATELCSLKRSDFDEENLTLRVMGKGKKVRTVRVSQRTHKALRLYLRETKQREDEPLFLGKQGRLRVSGLYQMIKRIADRAGVKHPGCHAFRRSFAIGMLRSGANAFSVQVLMGHSTLTMTRRYCAIAEADLAEQHMKHSPVERLKAR